MAVDANETIEISAQPEYYAMPLGGSEKGPRCGRMVVMGHPSAPGKWDVEAHVYTCRRAQCPRCYNLRGGYIDQAVRRIEAGILKGKAPGAEDRVTEYIVTPQADETALMDKEYRADVLRRARRALEGRTVNPGAWVLHWRPSCAPDTCPPPPHLHIFIETIAGSLPIGAPVKDPHGKPLEYRRLDSTLKIRRMPIPEVSVAVRVMGRVGYTSGMRGRGRKDRWVNLIGWFGRRGVGKKSEWDREAEADLKESRTVLCPVCHKEVPRRSWSAVSVSGLDTSKGGSWEVSETQIRPLEREWGG